MSSCTWMRLRRCCFELAWVWNDYFEWYFPSISRDQAPASALSLSASLFMMSSHAPWFMKSMSTPVPIRNPGWTSPSLITIQNSGFISNWEGEEVWVSACDFIVLIFKLLPGEQEWECWAPPCIENNELHLSFFCYIYIKREFPTTKNFLQFLKKGNPNQVCYLFLPPKQCRVKPCDFPLTYPDEDVVSHETTKLHLRS